MTQTAFALSHARKDLARCRLLAVYGSLRRCDPAARRFFPHPQARFRGEGEVPGLLYDLGPYPALQPCAPEEPPARVAVDLYEILDAALLGSLDAYEAYSPQAPEQSEYIRRLCPVTLSPSKTLTAWAYFFRKALPPETLLTGGNWCQALAEKGPAARRRGPLR